MIAGYTTHLMSTHDEEDDLLRDADTDEAIDDADPGIVSDEEIDSEVDAEGGAAIHKRTD